MSNLQWYWCSKQHTFIIQASCSCSCASSCSSLFWMQFHSLSHGLSFPWVLCGTVAKRDCVRLPRRDTKALCQCFIMTISVCYGPLLLFLFSYTTWLSSFLFVSFRFVFFSCAPYQFLAPIELGYLEELEIHCLIKAIAFLVSHTCWRIPRKLTGKTKSISTSRRRSCGI